MTQFGQDGECPAMFANNPVRLWHSPFPITATRDRHQPHSAHPRHTPHNPVQLRLRRTLKGD